MPDSTFHCHKCGSEHTISGDIEWNGGAELLISLSCNKCSHYWYAVFRHARDEVDLDILSWREQHGA